MISKLQDERLVRFLIFHADWPISFHTFTGEQLQPSFGKDNLLDLILQRERFVCDSNSFWKEEATKLSNQSKAFIIPFTTLDEADDIRGNLFGKKVNADNGNIFFFSTIPIEAGLGLAIERYDSEFIKRFPDKFRQASQERLMKTDAKYLEVERERIAQVQRQKENILSSLKMVEPVSLPPVEFAEREKLDRIKYIRSVSGRCFRDYSLSMNIVGLCCSALLLEQDDVGKKTRDDFNTPKKRNLFGDTLLVRDALWLNARILSSDRGVERIAAYVALPDIKVCGIT